MDTRTNRTPIYPLYAIRFIACLLVLFGHICLWAFAGIIEYQEAFKKIIPLQWLAMPAFFVLSGFLIHYLYHTISLRDWRTVKAYLLARIMRIYPLYIVMTIIYFATCNADMPYLITYAAGIQSWFYSLVDGKLYAEVFFSSAWAISTELFLYLMYPLIAWKLAGLSLRKTIMHAWLFGVCSLYFVASSCLLIAQGTTSLLVWWCYYSPYVRSIDFISGCLAAQIFLTLPATLSTNNKRWLHFFAALSLTAIVMQYYLVAHGFTMLWSVTYGYTPFLAVIILYCAKCITLPARSKFTQFVVTLGECSFVLYLLQEMLLNKFNVMAIGLYKNNALAMPIWLIFSAYTLILAGIAIYINGLYHSSAQYFSRRYAQVPH